jgi:hypothetical protein
MPATQPPQRTTATLVFNPDRGRIMLFGGRGDEFDTWEWDGIAWHARTPTDVPSIRTGTASAYNPTSRRVVMFGGSDADGLAQLGDTWTYAFESGSVPADACAAGIDLDGDGLAGCDDPDCWSRCTPACPPNTSCAATLPSCGDGTCDFVEDARICPIDCP